MSRKSPAGKTGPPRFEAGPQGSSAFLLQEPCRFFKTLRSAAFGEKTGEPPLFSHEKPETAPRFHAEAARRCAKKRKLRWHDRPRRKKKCRGPGLPETAAPKSARNEKIPPGTKRGSLGAASVRRRPEPAPFRRDCREARIPRPPPEFPRNARCAAPPFPAPPHRFSALRRFPPRRNFLVSTRAAFLSGGTVRAEIAAHPPRPCRTFLRDSLSHPRETPRPAPSPALSRSLRSARVGDTSCPR